MARSLLARAPALDGRCAFVGRGGRFRCVLLRRSCDEPRADARRARVHGERRRCEAGPSLALGIARGTGRALDAKGPADVELSGAVLASIAASGMRPAEAAELGFLRASADALATMERMFDGPRFLCLDPF